MILETLDRAGRAGVRVRRVAVVGACDAPSTWSEPAWSELAGNGPATTVLSGAPGSWVERLRRGAADGEIAIDALLAGDDATVRALIAADASGDALAAIDLVLIAGGDERLIAGGDGATDGPPLTVPLFDRGFVPLRGAAGGVTAYVRSDRLTDPAAAGGAGSASVTMTTLGGNGRFANQIFQYAFLRLYGLRAGVEIAVPPWEGEGLFGLSDRRPGPDRHPELRFYGFDDDDLALWDMDAPPVNVDFWGYFQEVPASWEHHRAFLRRLFTLRADWSDPIDAALAELRASGRTLVAIHVRRGDYVGFDKNELPWYRIVPTTWYRAWLDALLPTLPNPVLHVATDDPEAVLPEFDAYPRFDAAVLRTATGMPAHVLDFALLARADRLAMTNSSFSRFAALLADPERPTVLPSFAEKRFLPYEPWSDRAFWQRFATPEACRGTYGSGLGVRGRRSIMLRGMLGRTQAALSWSEGQTDNLRREVERVSGQAAAESIRLEGLLVERNATIAHLYGELDETRNRLAAERDAALVERDTALRDAAAATARHESEMAAFLASTSWRITVPVRLSKRLLRGGARKAYKLAGLVGRGDWAALREAVRANLLRGGAALRALPPPAAGDGPISDAAALAAPEPVRDAGLLPVPVTFAGNVWIGRGEVAARRELVAGLLRAPEPPRSPLVTVVVPCYNYGRFVEEALDSILAQTLTDLEVIVVDDGSTDPFTREVLDRIDRPRVTVLRQTNAGLPMARNNGIARANGTYICCLDADDTIEPTYLEKAVAVLEARADVGFAYSWLRLFGDEDGVWKTAPFDLDRITVENHISVAAVFRRSLWAAAGGYSPVMRGGYEDWEFWLRLGSLGAGGWCMPEALMNHRRHGRTMTADAQDIHQELVGRMRRLNPEAFDPAFRAMARDAMVPLPAPAPFAWLETAAKRDGGRRDGGSRDGDRPGFLLIVPWLEVGGSETVLLTILEAVRDIYDIVIVTTLAAENAWADRFRAVTPRLYHLPQILDPDQRVGFLAAAVRAWNIDCVMVSGSALGYQALGPMKEAVPRLRVFNLLHNAWNDGYIRDSLANDAVIDTHVAIAERVREGLHDRGADPAKVICIRNGIDTDGRFNPARHDRSAARAALGCPEDAVLIGFVGRLSAEKRPLDFLALAEILASDPSLRFLMVGDGVLGPEVRAAVEAAGLGPRLLFRPHADADAIAGLYAALDLLVMTSDIEGLPMVLVEAMALEVAAAATDVGDIGFVVRPGVNGTLLPIGDPAEAAVRIRALVADRVELARLRRQARATVLEEGLTTRDMIRGYRALLLPEPILA